MSKAIVLNEKEKQDILTYISNTYQCTITMVSNRFNLSPLILYNNFGKDYLSSLLFHGVRDDTRKKISKTLTGRKQTQETKDKRRLSCRLYRQNESEEKKKERVEKMLKSRALKWGSVKESYKKTAQKTRETKLLRYGNPGYNNMIKGKETKKLRYGNENYNNHDQIKKTQFEKYGNYAFAVKEKYEKTMLEKYGVTHNWASSDPKLNGWKTRIEKFGSKEEFYKYALEKGRKTRLELYGNEFYSNSEKAQQTMLEKYGVPFYTMTQDCINKGHTVEVTQRRIDTRRKNNTFNTSSEEDILYDYLCDICGEDNVYREYQDKRYANSEGYMFKCDFYIKSKDLFIELNLFPTHGGHPFDSTNFEDINTVGILKNNPTKWNLCVIDVWTRRDVEKLMIAKQNKLNYLSIYDWDKCIDLIKEKLE